MPNGICMVCDGEVVCKDITLDCVVSLGKSVDSSSLGWILLDLSKSHDYGAGFDKFLGRTVRMFVDGVFIGDAVIPEDFFETYKVCVCVGISICELVRGGAMAVPAVIVFTFFAGLFALDGVWLLKRRGYMSFVTSRWGAVWRMLDLVHMWRMRFADGFFLVIVVVAVVFVSFRGGQRSSCSDLNAVHGGDVCVPNGICMVCILKVFGSDETQTLYFSKSFEVDGMQFETPTVHTFSFNSPLGACPACEGFGRVIGIDEDLVVPNKTLSIYEDAVACWRGEVMGEFKRRLMHSADKFGFPVHKPYYELTDAQRELLWTGNEHFEGLNDFFKMLEANQYKIQYRVMLARYRGKTTCPDCRGSRLKKEASYVRVGEKSISELVLLPVTKLKEFFDTLELNEQDASISKRLMVEINNRIQFLLDVGLGYLTLNRLSNSLSGGESQRINLATSLGSSLVGSLYILDEPSIGLHSRDTHLLIKVLKQLRDLGNTVVVVEHDEEIMRAADFIIDIGPEAGRKGGEVVFKGKIPENGFDTSKTDTSKSYTLKYLTGAEKIDIPERRRKWNNYIEVLGARENNLKGIDVKFPLNVMTVVTGVSGSGKSSLVRNVFYAALKKHYGGVADRTGKFGALRGSMMLAKDVEFVDQNPIGRSTRSNPVTYIKAYDEIRKLFADQQLSKQMGYAASFFSFNTEGGRCEECQGEGTVTVEMQFMADLVLECEHCHGKRFKQDILEVQYKEKNIFDVLEMTVNQAIEFFGAQSGNTEKKIVKRLKPLQDVGIGYVKLGQSSSTLSGGESQRVKLAAFLANEKPEPTIFVFDEPTTGLHFHDIKTLLKAFDALIAKGHTVIIIEHNMEVIKSADHIIDIGPEGGERGGNLVFEGTPEALVDCECSYTGKFLKEKL